MYDISAARGIKVTITMGGSSTPFEFKGEDFADDAPPVSITPLTVGDPRIDMNRRLFHGRRLQTVRIDLAPIPWTDADIKFKKFLISSRKETTSEKDIKVDSIIVQSDEMTITLTDGVMPGGLAGVVLSNDGRLGTGTYSFEFVDIEVEISPYYHRFGDAYDTIQDSLGEDGGSGNNKSNSSDKKRKQKYGLKGTSGFTPLTTTGKQMMQPNWKTPLTTNKWYQ